MAGPLYVRKGGVWVSVGAAEDGGSGDPVLDGAWIAMGDNGSSGQLQIWVDSGGSPSQLTATASHDVSCVAWAPDGSRVYASTAASGSPGLVVVDVDGDTVESGWDTPSSEWCEQVAVSPDGSKLALGMSTSPPYYHVYDTATKAHETGWPSAGFRIFAVAWSPDGTQLALVERTDKVIVIDVAAKTSSSWATTAGNVHAVAWSPDGTRLAVGHTGGNFLSVYDASDGTIESGWPQPPGDVYGVAWSPDGTRLAVANYRGGSPQNDAFKVIDVDTKTFESGWPATPSTLSGRAVSWRSDGERLAVALQDTDKLLVIDVSTKTEDTGWPTPGGRPDSVAFAYDPANVTSG